MVKIAKLNSRNRPAGNKPIVAPIRLDIGCGPNKRKTDNEGKPQDWVGVDSIKFPGVDVVTDLNKPWPWADNSVEEAHSSHCLEHFDAQQRVHFLNELWRVLKPNGVCSIIVPHWASCRAYGDPTHKWPPVSEFAFYYYLKSWRMANAPHTDADHNPQGFRCNFDVVWGYGYHPELQSRNAETQAEWAKWRKEAIWDIHCKLTALK